MDRFDGSGGFQNEGPDESELAGDGAGKFIPTLLTLPRPLSTDGVIGEGVGALDGGALTDHDG